MTWGLNDTDNDTDTCSCHQSQALQYNNITVSKNGFFFGVTSVTVDSFHKRNFLVAYGKMFWSSEDRVRARFHYAESRQNKP